MKSHEIEAWALSVIDRVNAHEPDEDFLVELKSSWPDDHAKTARQIAGHANAARGENLLWLIGVSQRRGVVGVDRHELATWYDQVKSNFNGIPPAVIDRNLDVEGKTVVALLFDTSYSPYVVKNPRFNKSGGGWVEFEVPWREHTSTRSATHNDLIKLLVPIQKMPVFEIHESELGLEQSANFPWTLEMHLYIYPKSEGTLFIPFHRCEVCVEVPGCLESTIFENVILRPPFAGDLQPYRDSLTIRATHNEVCVNGPGKIILYSGYMGKIPGTDHSENAKVQVKIMPADVERPVTFEVVLQPSEPYNNQIARWLTIE